MQDRLTVWVEAEAIRYDSTWWDHGKIRKVKVGRLLRKRPREARPDCHLIRVDIDVPRTAFEHTVKVELT